MQTLLDSAALVVALLALIIAYLSWRASVSSVRAAVYDQRYRVYEDAEQYLGLWMQSGKPNMDKLHLIISAWNRSHFLFSPSVTSYLRELWVDSVKAAELHMVMSGELEGDHSASVKRYYELLTAHTDFDRLRNVFLNELKVDTSLKL